MKYMEGTQLLMFQTERLKVAEEMAKTKAPVHIFEEPCQEILERKKDVTGMRSLIHKTFSHQNEPGISTTVPVNVKSKVNMDSGASRESHIIVYHKVVSRQDVLGRRIGMNGRSLQDQMKTWQPAKDVNPRDRNSSTDEDANHKASSMLCKLLQ